MRPPRTLPKGSVARLRAGLKRAQSKSEFQRLQCVWLRASWGLSADQVVTAIGWRAASVRRLQAHHLRQGEAALQGVSRGGRRRQNLTPQQQQQLLSDFTRRRSGGGMLEVSRVKGPYEQAVGRSGCTG